MNQCFDHLKKLAPLYKRIALDLLDWERIGSGQFVTWHKLESLFKKSYYIIYSNVEGGEPIADFLYTRSWNPSEEDYKIWAERLKEIGQVLLVAKRPWVYLERENASSFGGYSPKRPVPSGSALFGLFAILAYGYEFDERHDFHRHRSWDELQKDYPVPIRWAFCMRSRSDGRPYSDEENTFEDEFKNNDFTPDERLFIEDWADGALTLVSG